MGNYELENCKLKPNYIPVGIKEYNGILYIVSYNPLDDHVEVGSYPSPLQVSAVESNNYSKEFNSIIKKELIDAGKKSGKYTELVEKEVQIVFNGDDYKLYPGDQYSIDPNPDIVKYLYEAFEYFIIDDASAFHDITNEIEIDNKYHNVS
jgi:hypothetical protein